MDNISIIIITKNRAKFLGNCLGSLKGQLEKGDEVFVILDSKTKDGSEEILLRYKKIIPLVYYKSDVRGYPQNFNLGINKSRKDILVFINDDCIVKHNFVQKIKMAHNKRPLSVVQGMTYSLPKNNIYAEITGDNYRNWIAINHKDVLSNLMNTIDNKNVSIPRGVFRQVGYYNEAFTRGSEDIEFGFRLVRLGIPIIFDPSIVVYHYERATFFGFVNQHVRFAVSESIVDRMLPPERRIHAINWHKTSLHMKSAIKRELLYAQQFRIKDFLLLPFLYMLLFCIRMYGYYIKSA
jgi:GT2 family glycosyltransferase